MIKVDGQAVKLQKRKEKYIWVYHNKQSVFTDLVRQRIFSIKSKPTLNKTKNDLLYIPVNLWKIISEVFSDYVTWGWIDVKFQDDNKQNKFNETIDVLNIFDKINKWTTKQSYVWYSILRLRTTEDNPTKDSLRLDVIPTNNYYPVFGWINIGDWFTDLKWHQIISEVSQVNNGVTEALLYVDSYTKDLEWRIYTKEVYKSLWNQNRAFYSNKENWFVLEDPIEILIEPTKIDFLPLFLINNSTDDEDEIVSNIVFWQSDYSDIMELLQEYNDRYSQVSVEFIKYLESALSIPSQLYKEIQQQKRLRKQQNTKDWEDFENYVMDNLWKIYVHWAGEEPAHYLVKDIQTDKALLWLKQLITDVSNIVWIPENFLWVKWEKEITATEIIYNRDRFDKKILRKQKEIKPELMRLFWTIAQLLAWWDIELPRVFFKESKPIDNDALADYYIKLRTNWMISKETAIQKSLLLDEKALEEEIQRINDENIIEANITRNDVLSSL